jgi:hypothetical protein
MMSVTPLAAQVSISLSRMEREEFAMSVVFSPTAFAETAQAGGRTARFHDRRREIEVFAEGFRHDGGIGQNRRGTGDLHGVAGLCSCRHCRNRQDGNRSRGKLQMGHDFSIGFCPGREAPSTRCLSALRDGS